MMLSDTEREELEFLRKSAAKFMTNPLDRACFQLEGLLELSDAHIYTPRAFRMLIKAFLLHRDITQNEKN